MSFLGYKWEKLPMNQQILNYLKQHYELGDIANNIIAQNNISHEDIKDFLNPKLKHLIPEPFHLLDMDKAVSRTIKAITNKENMFIIADYDVDGATACASMQRFFYELGVQTQIYIPDRIKEGYGPSPEIIKKLKDKGAQLLFTLDCGSTAYGAMTAASALSIDTIVIDHHICKELAKDAYAIVNPNRFDETSNMGNLAAVGVVFLFLTALYIRMRDSNLITRKIELLSYLDLVALGTVCDVVSLTGLNRALVKQGLKIVNARSNKGIDALCKISSIDSAIECYHLGFILGPKINAGGRVGKSSLGSHLLACKCDAQALELAQQLNYYNHCRQNIESDILQLALELAKSESSEGIIYLAEQNWHLGVIGIIASRIKDLYNKPAVIIAVENGIGKGSCRSVEGFDIGGCISCAVKAGLLIAGGGHAMAAGFTIEKSKIGLLKEFLKQELQKLKITPTKKKHYNLDLDFSEINICAIKQINILSPFGQGNPEPIFKLSKAQIIFPEKVGGKHIKFMLKSQNITMPCIAFNAQSNNLSNAITDNIWVSCIGTFKLNSWLGKTTAQFFVQDIDKH